MIKIDQLIRCIDENVVYCIECSHCGMQYIGKTKNQFRKRMIQHRNIIGSSSSGVALHINHWNPVVYALHFEKKGHSSHNFVCFAIEKVVGDEFVLAARERFYIDKLDVISRGMNTHRT